MNGYEKAWEEMNEEFTEDVTQAYQRLVGHPYDDQNVIFREEKEDGRVVEHMDTNWLVVKRTDGFATTYSIYRPV